MLARSFLSATDLGISEPQWNALLKVLHALERGELTHAREGESLPNGFHMAQWKCGSTHCIGGWAEHFSSDPYLFSGVDIPRNLDILFYPGCVSIPGTHSAVLGIDIYDECTPANAAHALSNYLTTGEPRWAAVMAV